MGIRETLNKNPAITTGVTAAIIVAALVFIFMSQFGSDTPEAITKGYYTADDGATYIADSIDLVPPFTKDGKEYVRVHVYKDAAGNEFPAYLERYTKDAKAKIEAFEEKRKSGAAVNYEEMDAVRYEGLEVKKPKDPGAKWVKQIDSANSSKIMEVLPPGGGPVTPVFPN